MLEGLSLFFSALSIALLRPLGVFLLSPLFSQQSLGGILTRNALLLLIALPAVPIIIDHVEYVEWSNYQFISLVLKEIFIGILIGFSATICFWAIDIASFILDTMRGASMATLLNPLLGEASSILGMFFSQLISVLFLGFGGFEKLLSTIYHSYSFIQPGSSLTMDTGLFIFLKEQWHLMFTLALSFAVPSIIVMILTDICLGLLNRSAQQINVFFLSMPLKSILTVLLLMLSLNFSINLYLENIKSFDDAILNWIKK